MITANGSVVRPGPAASPFVVVVSFLMVFAGLVLPSVMPEVANVGVALTSLLALCLTGVRHTGRLWRQPAIWMPLLGLGVLAVSQVATARSAADLVPLLAVAPVLLIFPIAVALRHLSRAADVVHHAALLGTISAAALSAYEVYVLTFGRAGVSVANPIHFADTTIVLGIVAAAGLAQRYIRLRVLLLLAPILAAFAVYLSGSRGPILAIPGVGLAVALAWILASMPWRRSLALGVVILATAAMATLVAWQMGWLANVPGVADIQRLLSGAPTEPGSVGERVAMYQGGLRAFQESPWVGHGLANFVAAALGENSGISVAYDHLHSDIADFGVAGGVLGLTAYALFILAPIAQAVASRHEPVVVVLGAGLAAGYLLMGLTNAVIGMVTLTVLYAFCLALQLRFGTSQEGSAKAETGQMDRAATVRLSSRSA